MSKKHYVIWKGAKEGVFDNWTEVQAHTSGRKDAQYMGFPSYNEAVNAYKGTYTQALIKRSVSGKPAKTSTKKSVSPVISTSFDYNIYSDGACSPNPGKSGTGMAVYEKGALKELWYGLYENNGTNNTAELNGLYMAFRYAQSLIKNPSLKVQILSDSKYSIDCITKWAKGWKSKGWVRGKGEEIKNLTCIQTCYELYLELAPYIHIVHVKGHANIEGNELADRMAVLARMKQEKKLKRFEEKMSIKDILALPSG